MNTENTQDSVHESNTAQPSIVIVVVEDDPLLRDLITRHLTKSGCTPYATAHGGEAMALIEKSKPDIIVLDLMLPEVSGEEILKLLKSNELYKSIPVIAFTNRSEESDKEKIESLGADAYLIKATTELSELTMTINTLVGNSRRQA